MAMKRCLDLSKRVIFANRKLFLQVGVVPKVDEAIERGWFDRDFVDAVDNQVTVDGRAVGVTQCSLPPEITMVFD